MSNATNGVTGEPDSLTPASVELIHQRRKALSEFKSSSFQIFTRELGFFSQYIPCDDEVTT